MRARIVRWWPTAVNVVAAGLFVFLYLQVHSQTAQVHRQAAAGRQALVALCVLKADLAQRVHQSDVFLRKHPNGAFGFTRAEILTGRNNQQRTVDSLSGLNCPRKETR